MCILSKPPQSDDERIAKRLLSALFEKQVLGFCTEVTEACKILDVSSNKLLEKPDVRKYMKEKLVGIQRKQVLQRMLLSSEMDRVLPGGFKFDKKVMKYISELEFPDARAVFMARYRMLPTKSNFPGRWNGICCNICGFEDTDAFVFTCPGYVELNINGISIDLFWNAEAIEDSADACCKNTEQNNKSHGGYSQCVKLT